MPELRFIKHPSGLMPMDEAARGWLVKQPASSVVTGKFSTNRNPDFHRKFFAMLNIAYENWDKPVVQTPLGEARCTYKKFRNDVTVLAGYHDLVCNTKGEWRCEAKSIQFGSMEQGEFEELYSAVLDVILAKFLTKWSSEDMHDAVVGYIRDFG